MATITPVAASTNAAVTYTAASGGGDTIACGTSQRTTFLVRNAGSTITVTLAAVATCNQGFTHNLAVTCAVGDTEIAIPAYCLTTTGTIGNVAVTYSSATSVTVAAVTN